MTYEGVLAVWKPVDWTSHDVVAKVRRLIGVKRIGHTGTLDPKVTGVLPLCIGRATRMVEYIQELPKSYEAVLTVGHATDTEDDSGSITEKAGQVKLDESRVLEVLQSFVGEIEQVPPMYSAVKVDGRRLYELAREGKEVERKGRRVSIYRMEPLGMDLTLAEPVIRFRVSCSKGTYIRTLCTDIGRALGYPAVMSGLVRTSTGPFTQADCVTLEDIEECIREGSLDSRLIPADRAIGHLPALTLTAEDAVRARQGRTVPVSSGKPSGPEDLLSSDPDRLPASAAGEDSPAADLYRLYGPDRLFLGLFRLDAEQKLLIPEKVFN